MRGGAQCSDAPALHALCTAAQHHHRPCPHPAVLAGKAPLPAACSRRAAGRAGRPKLDGGGRTGEAPSGPAPDDVWDAVAECLEPLTPPQVRTAGAPGVRRKPAAPTNVLPLLSSNATHPQLTHATFTRRHPPAPHPPQDAALDAAAGLMELVAAAKDRRRLRLGTDMAEDVADVVLQTQGAEELEGWLHAYQGVFARGGAVYGSCFQACGGVVHLSCQSIMHTCAGTTAVKHTCSPTQS